MSAALAATLSVAVAVADLRLVVVRLLPAVARCATEGPLLPKVTVVYPPSGCSNAPVGV
jgi:hypothetical protein